MPAREHSLARPDLQTLTPAFKVALNACEPL
jgi:hypothetical protein